MPLGQKCPICGSQTLQRHQDGYQRCSNGTCGFLGLSFFDKVGPGKGKGNKCPSCKKATLHNIAQVRSGLQLYRCSICAFTGVGR